MSAPAGPDLRDIHLPPAPSWWPPAPGWWLLAALLIAAIVVSVWLIAKHWRERRWRQRIVAELDRIAAMHAAQPDPVKLAADVSQLLRRVSLLIEPEAAALQGEAWLAFLDRRFEHGGEESAEQFRSDAGRALIDAPYRRADDPHSRAVDAPRLLGLARSWLKRALPRGRAHV